MDEPVSVVALLTGLLLGGVFFGGLWWTVQTGVRARRPVLWFAASLPVRAAIALGGFYLVAGTDWKRLLPCLLGFVVARFIVMRVTASGKLTEAGHAP